MKHLKQAATSVMTTLIVGTVIYLLALVGHIIVDIIQNKVNYL